jgi:predicted Rossmann-fold nucleotide-binding protein
MLNWLQDTMLAHSMISEDDFKLFHIADTPSEVVEIVLRSQSSIAELTQDDLGVPTLGR